MKKPETAHRTITKTKQLSMNESKDFFSLKIDICVYLYQYSHPIAALLCFLKILERIKCHRLYQYLTENKVLYSKQFGFQTGHSTEHAIVQLVDQILQSFE